MVEKLPLRGESWRQRLQLELFWLLLELLLPRTGQDPREREREREREEGQEEDKKSEKERVTHLLS